MNDDSSVYKVKSRRDDESWEEFRDQCRRQMARPLDQRIKYPQDRRSQ